jgi:DNA-binding winged helix-turn-helix (wHTH) protein/TolB-like protein
MLHRIGTEPLPSSETQTRDSAPRAEVLAAAWRFEGFDFDLLRGELRGRDGSPISLRPKAEALLRALLAKPGRLLSRDELMAAVWPATVVTDDSLVQCVGELRAALSDQTQTLIRTVPRRGYRLDAAVTTVPLAALASAAAPAEASPVLELKRPALVTAAPAPAAPEPAGPEPVAPPAAAAPARPARSVRSLRVWMLAGAVAAGVAVGAALLLLRPAVAPSSIDAEFTARGTVAVMPFVAVPDEPALRVAADAVVDEIVAQFATRIGMRGIGRAATSAYDASTPPLARIATELKARYVVTGRVASVGGGRTSLDAQIINVADGEGSWSRRYERSEADGKPLAQDVGLHVVNVIRGFGIKVAEKPQNPGSKPSAFDLTVMGWRDLDRPKSLEDIWRARSRFQAALRDDPHSVIATNGLASTYVLEGNNPVNRRFSAEQKAEYERAVVHARALAPDDPTALLTWGYLQFYLGRPDLTLPAAEKVTRQVPSYPSGHFAVGQALMLLGRAEEVQAKVERVLATAPNDTRRVSLAHSLAAEAALMLGQVERARDQARRSVAANPSNAYAHGAAAAADALAGRTHEAEVALAALLKLWPSATVANYDELRRSTHPTYLAQRDRLYEGLRKAGLPER